MNLSLSKNFIFLGTGFVLGMSTAKFIEYLQKDESEEQNELFADDFEDGYNDSIDQINDWRAANSDGSENDTLGISNELYKEQYSKPEVENPEQNENTSYVVSDNYEEYAVSEEDNVEESVVILNNDLKIDTGDSNKKYKSKYPIIDISIEEFKYEVSKQKCFVKFVEIKDRHTSNLLYGRCDGMSSRITEYLSVKDVVDLLGHANAIKVIASTESIAFYNQDTDLYLLFYKPTQDV